MAYGAASASEQDQVVKISAGGALVTAFRFVVPGWRHAWAALLIFALTNGLLNMARVLAPASWAWSWVVWFGQLGLLLAAAAPVHGALTRLGLRDRHPHDDSFRLGPGGLQWRMTETWMFVATLAYNLIFYAAFETMRTLGLWPSLQGFNLAALALSGPIWLAFVSAWIWVALRMMAFPPAITEWKRFVLFGAWSLTAKAFWRLLPAFLIGFVAQLVPSLALAPITTAVAAGGLGGAQAPIDFAAGLIVGLIRALALPFATGAALYIYRAAVPSPEAAAVFD
jgi:hypothetical protein